MHAWLRYFSLGGWDVWTSSLTAEDISADLEVGDVMGRDGAERSRPEGSSLRFIRANESSLSVVKLFVNVRNIWPGTL